MEYNEERMERKRPAKGSGKLKFDKGTTGSHSGSLGKNDMRGNDYKSLKDSVEKSDDAKLNGQRCNKY